MSGVNAICTYNPFEKKNVVFDERYILKNYSNDYDSFLKKVDAVYIASPNETHFQYAKDALEAGKHVLCEKPLCFKKKEAEELYNYAKENDLVLMEAIRSPEKELMQSTVEASWNSEATRYFLR